MENSSKALLIAASVLIVILLITFGIRIFSSSKNAVDVQKTSQEIAGANDKGTSTIKDQIGIATDSGQSGGQFPNGGVLYANGESVSFPEGITRIERSSFTRWDIKKLVIPKTVTSIENDIFKGKNTLEEVEIYDDGTRSLGNLNFSGCRNLKSINLPQKNSSILTQAFQNCSSLQEITIPSKVKKIYAQTFENCTSLNTVQITGRLNEILAGAFRNCSSLKAITIPSSVNLIAENAFSGCSDITFHYSGTAAGFPWGATNATLVSD